MAQPPVKAGKALPPEDFGFEVLGWLGGPCTAVTIEGDFAYVGEGLGLSIFDLSDIEAPLHVGGIRLPGVEWGGMQTGIVDEIIVSDGLAYVLVNLEWLPSPGGPPHGTVHVVDVADPSAPDLRSSFGGPDDALDFAKSGAFGYVACYQTLQIVDLSDPDAPAARGSAEVTGFAVATSANVAYVASVASLVVVDVTDADSPAPIETVSLGGFVWFDVALSGDRAYLAGREYGDSGENDKCTFVIVSLADPLHPDRQGYLEIPYDGEGTRVAVSGDRAYVTDSEGAVHVVDVSDPEAPSLIVTCPTEGRACDMALGGNWALVAGREAGLLQLDLASPDSPTVVRGLTFGEPLDFVVVGDRLYATRYGGFSVGDIGNPGLSRVLGGCETPCLPGYLALSGDHAFVTMGACGLLVVDVGEPAHPSCVGTFPTAAYVYGVAADGNFAYVAEGGRVQVVDATTPEAPVGRGVVADVYLGGDADLAVRDGLVLLASDTGVTSINVSDPDAPFVLDHVDGVGPQRLAVLGNLVYAMVMGRIMDVYYVSPDGSLAALGTYLLASGGAHHVAIAGGSAYLSVMDWPALQAMDMGAPFVPETVGSYWSYGGFWRVRAVRDRVYASGYAGIALLRASGLPQCDVLADFEVEGELLASMALSLGLDGNGDGLVNGADAVWDNWDMNRDGVPDRWQLAVLAHIVCAQDEAYDDRASIAYNTNNALFAADNPEQAADFPHVIAGLLSIGSGMVQPLVDGGLVSGTQPYQAYGASDGPAHEPLSGEGDMDGDGLTGSDEYLRVLLAGGGMDDYVFAVMTPWADGSPLPTADPIALAALIALIAASRFRRRGSS